MKSWASSSCLLFLGLVSLPAWGGDYWVDAVNGDNANSGSAPDQAWQTISHALAQTTGSRTIHIAPGLYDAALGESYPLAFCGDTTLVGDVGLGPVILDGGGAGAVVRWEAQYSDCGSPTLDRLWLRNAATGVDVVARDLYSETFDVSLRDLLITDMGLGVRGEARNWFAWDEFCDVEIRMTRVQVRDCGGGAEAFGGSWDDAFAYALIICEDCDITDNGGGLVAWSDPEQGEDSAAVVLIGCRIEDNQGSAVSVSDAGGTVMGCLIARNGSGTYNGMGYMGLSGCTIVENVGAGVAHDTALSNCIVYGNGDDIVAVGPTVSASYCDIGDGDFVGINGNISADPRFWGPGDYHLKPGSPCIDAGDPASPTDPDGSVADMGAFPFDPTYVPGAVVFYCTAKPSSAGCLAAVTTSDPASAPVSGQGDYLVSAQGVQARKTGLFFFGLSGATAQPFLGGTLCALPPLGRTPIQFSGGSGPGACDGAMDLVVNDGSSLFDPGPGGSVWLQAWYRDPDNGPGILGTALSDAVALTMK